MGLTTFLRRLFKRFRPRKSKYSQDGRTLDRAKDVEKWQDRQPLLQADYVSYRWKVLAYMGKKRHCRETQLQSSSTEQRRNAASVEGGRSAHDADYDCSVARERPRPRNGLRGRVRNPDNHNPKACEKCKRHLDHEAHGRKSACGYELLSEELAECKELFGEELEWQRPSTPCAGGSEELDLAATQKLKQEQHQEKRGQARTSCGAGRPSEALECSRRESVRNPDNHDPEKYEKCQKQFWDAAHYGKHQNESTSGYRLLPHDFSGGVESSTERRNHKDLDANGTDASKAARKKPDEKAQPGRYGGKAGESSFAGGNTSPAKLAMNSNINPGRDVKVLVQNSGAANATRNRDHPVHLQGRPREMSRGSLRETPRRSRPPPDRSNYPRASLRATMKKRNPDNHDPENCEKCRKHLDIIHSDGDYLPYGYNQVADGYSRLAEEDSDEERFPTAATKISVKGKRKEPEEDTPEGYFVLQVQPHEDKVLSSDKIKQSEPSAEPQSAPSLSRSHSPHKRTLPETHAFLGGSRHLENNEKEINDVSFSSKKKTKPKRRLVRTGKRGKEILQGKRRKQKKKSTYGRVDKEGTALKGTTEDSGAVRSRRKKAVKRLRKAVGNFFYGLSQTPVIYGSPGMIPRTMYDYDVEYKYRYRGAGGGAYPTSKDRCSNTY